MSPVKSLLSSTDKAIIDCCNRHFPEYKKSDLVRQKDGSSLLEQIAQMKAAKKKFNPLMVASLKKEWPCRVEHGCDILQNFARDEVVPKALMEAAVLAEHTDTHKRTVVDVTAFVNTYNGKWNQRMLYGV